MIFEKKKKKIEGPTSDLCKSSIRKWRKLWYPSLVTSGVLLPDKKK